MADQSLMARPMPFSGSLYLILTGYLKTSGGLALQFPPLSGSR
jgi:hypothetical protein